MANDAIFGSGALQRYIDDAFIAVPPDRRGAAFVYVVRDRDGSVRTRVAVAARVGDRWEIGGSFEADKQAGRVDFGAGVFVRGTW